MMPGSRSNPKVVQQSRKETEPGRRPRLRGRMLALLLAVVPFLLSCYTVTLSLRMDESGQGTAWVYMDYHVPEGEQVDLEAANKILQDKGWNTETCSSMALSTATGRTTRMSTSECSR